MLKIDRCSIKSRRSVQVLMFKVIICSPSVCSPAAPWLGRAPATSSLSGERGHSWILETFVRNELQPELVLEIKTKLWDFDFNSITFTFTKTFSSYLVGERSELLSRLGQSLLIDLRAFDNIPLFFNENLRWPRRLQSAAG